MLAIEAQPSRADKYTPLDQDVGPGVRPVPARQQAEEITRRLIVLLRRGRVEKMIARDGFVHEEGVDAADAAADQAVTLPPSEPHQRFEAGTEIVGEIPGLRGVVGHHARKWRPQRRIIFDRDDARLDHLDGLPDPIVILVDIDAQKIDLAADATLLDQRIDVFGGDKRLDRLQPVLPEEGVKATPNLRNISLRAVDPKTTPAFEQELDRIAFDSGLDPKLDEGAVCGPNPPEDLLDDPVFVALRVHLEPVTQEALRIAVARLGQFVIPIPKQLHLRGET